MTRLQKIFFNLVILIAIGNDNAKVKIKHELHELTQIENGFLPLISQIDRPVCHSEERRIFTSSSTKIVEFLSEISHHRN
ncbi:hypothetical protein AB674_08855 [Flavobacterium sp. ABG]|nr:hypothetical protein AB674_08855 [Flavobacterium sp. ABG]